MILCSWMRVHSISEFEISKRLDKGGNPLTCPGDPVRPMKETIKTNPVAPTALIGTPDLHWRNLLVINSGPV